MHICQSNYNLSDCHSHSCFSPDGSDSVEAMLARAKELGLRYYALTDHCECNAYKRDGFDKSTAKGYQAMCALQEGLKQGGTVFLKGLELGQATQDKRSAEAVLQDKDYDFVLGSVHNIRGFEDFYFLDYDNVERSYIDDLLTRYFKEELELISWGKFDSLSHLTYPLRYIRDSAGNHVDLTGHMDEVEAVLSAVIREKKALEINTSGLRQEIGCTLPDLPVLSLYKKMGGEYVTIGSDAHRASDLGKGITEGMQALLQAGFENYTVYKKHEPIPVPIQQQPA